MAGRIYRGVDCLWVRLPEVEPLYTFLTESLGLPVSWPLQHHPSGSFARVTLGNVALELWSAGLPGAALDPPEFCGLALEPENIQSATRQLERLGICSKALRPFEVDNAQGAPVASVTNAVLMNLSSPECSVFLSEWRVLAKAAPWVQRANQTLRRQQDQQSLQACGGGALGVYGLAEIEIETPDYAVAERDWRQLTGSQAELRLTDDIALRLADGNETRISALTVAVHSLAAAKAFLAAQGMVGDESLGSVVISRRVTEGLLFRVVEAQAVESLEWPELAYA